MKVLGIWAGMAGLLVLAYGVLIDTPVRKGWLPSDLAGLIMLAMAAGLIAWGVKLTRRSLLRRNGGGN